MRADPLRGLMPRQVHIYERQCALYLAEHPGWYAEIFDTGVVVAMRFDNEHWQELGNVAISDCIDCGANLQAPEPTELPTMCVACACRRASESDPACEAIYRGN